MGLDVAILLVKVVALFAVFGFSVAMINDWVEAIRTKDKVDNPNVKMFLVTLSWTILMSLILL